LSDVIELAGYECARRANGGSRSLIRDESGGISRNKRGALAFARASSIRPLILGNEHRAKVAASKCHAGGSMNLRSVRRSAPYVRMRFARFSPTGSISHLAALQVAVPKIPKCDVLPFPGRVVRRKFEPSNWSETDRRSGFRPSSGSL